VDHSFIYTLLNFCAFDSCPPQCCLLFWYRGTASSMPSIPCCPGSATLCNRMSHTCPRMPPFQNPFLRPTPFLSRIHLEIASQTPLEVAAVPPSLIRHPAPTPEVHSRCQVRSRSALNFSISSILNPNSFNLIGLVS